MSFNGKHITQKISEVATQTFCYFSRNEVYNFVGICITRDFDEIAKRSVIAYLLDSRLPLLRTPSRGRFSVRNSKRTREKKHNELHGLSNQKNPSVSS